MHVRPDAFKLNPILAQLIGPGAAKARQATGVEGKTAPVTSVDAAAAGDAAATDGDQAQIARPEKSAEKRPRPDAPGHSFESKTLGALIDAQARLEARAERLVDALDTDGDGGFSLAELKDALPGKSGEAPGRAARAERLFGEIDADGDGKVTLAELKALFLPKPEEETPETATAEAASEVIDPQKTTPSAEA